MGAFTPTYSAGNEIIRNRSDDSRGYINTHPRVQGRGVCSCAAQLTDFVHRSPGHGTLLDYSLRGARPCEEWWDSGDTHHQ